MDPQAVSFGSLDWLAIGLSWLAMLILGAVWYSPVTPMGRAWMRNLGLDPSNQETPDGAQLGKSILLMAVGSFLMILVFAFSAHAFENAFRSVPTGGDTSNDLTLGATITAAFIVWLGFIVPMNLNAVSFEDKPWRIFWVDTGFYLTGLVVAAILLGVL